MAIRRNRLHERSLLPMTAPFPSPGGSVRWTPDTPAGPGGLQVQAPWQPARVTGALLGVAGGEAWRGPRGGFENGGAVTAALLDLCRSCTPTARCPARSPRDIARRHGDAHGPGWLLPLVLVSSGPGLAEEAAAVATEAGALPGARDMAVAYVRLAAEVLVATTVDRAVEVAADHLATVPGEWTAPAPRDARGWGPRSRGDIATDAVTAAVWALRQPGGTLSSLAPTLAWWCEPPAAAAAAGLLGLRDGCGAVPAQWHRRLPVARELRDLAPTLVAAGPARIDLVAAGAPPARAADDRAPVVRHGTTGGR